MVAVCSGTRRGNHIYYQTKTGPVIRLQVHRLGRVEGCSPRRTSAFLILKAVVVGASLVPLVSGVCVGGLHCCGQAGRVRGPWGCLPLTLSTRETITSARPLFSERNLEVA